MTVEAACLVPFVLVILLVMIYLCFYIHNRSWLTAAAHEAALSGSMEANSGTDQLYEHAWEKAELLGNTGFFGAEDVALSVVCQGEVRVSYQVRTKSMLGYGDRLSAEGSAQVVRPLEELRRARKGKGGGA